MEETVIPQGTKPDVQALYKYFFGNAMGTPIVFTGVPTLAEMPDNSWGFYGNDIYIKNVSGAGIKLAGSAFT